MTHDDAVKAAKKLKLTKPMRNALIRDYHKEITGVGYLYPGTRRTCTALVKRELFTWDDPEFPGSWVTLTHTGRELAAGLARKGVTP